MPSQDVVLRLLPLSECVVEERLWMHGAEVISHVNYSQLDRICAIRGIPRIAREDIWPPWTPQSQDEDARLAS